MGRPLPPDHQIPNEPLLLRLIFLPRGNGPPEDTVVPLSWSGRGITMKDADQFLREIATTLGAHNARIETRDGGFIRSYYR
jgi:hypothetical protein